MSKNFPPNFFSGSGPVALISGGASFVGSYVCKALLGKAVKVICVDNWQTGVRENLSDLGDDDNFFLLEQDTTRPLTNVSKSRYVLHLAGIESYLNGEEISIEGLEANSSGVKNLLELAVEKNARFLLASSLLSQDEGKHFAEAITNEYAQKKNLDVRIVRLADVYGPKMRVGANNPIAKLLKQAVYQEPLKVVGSREVNVFPVYIDDVVTGIEKALFSSGTKGITISLSGPKTSLFSFAQTLKNISGGEGEIEFSNTEQALRDEAKEEVFYAGRKLISWTPTTTLEQGLAKTLEWLKKHKERVPKQKEKKEGGEFWKEEKRNKKGSVFVAKLRPVFFVIFLLLAWFVFLPPVSLLVGGFALKLTRDSAFAGDDKKVGLSIDKLRLWANIAQSSLGLAENGFGKWGYIPGAKNESARLVNSAATLGRLARILETAALVAKQAKTLSSSVVVNEDFDLDKLSSDLSVDLKALEKQLAFFETEAEDIVQIPWLVSPMPKKEEISSLRQSIGAASGIVAELPALLGTEGKKTYLVLFQNNMELRPTGGFIGSFSLLTFEKGRLVNTEVQDVYSADGQLKGHIEPPIPIKEHMGQKAWFLRDSNWSPHFPASAKQAAWFLEQELGVKVNGVIAIDLEFAKGLVRETGSVELSDFNRIVDSNNFYEVTQREAEEDFFPGSRAKKDFLTALTRALLSRITDDPAGHILPAARVAFASLEERHMAVWTDNNSVNKIFRRSGWDGAIEKVVCSKTCISDYLQIVDANLGINKSNYFLERLYSLETTLGEGRVGHKLAINYNNKSQAGVWPGGEYKNYLRVFAPQGSKAILATIINPKTGESVELDIDTDKEQEKEVFGTILTVPAEESRQVVILWDTPTQTKNVQEMVFLWQKQAGIGSDLVSFRINVPSGTGIVAVPEPSLTQASSASYNTTLARDLLVNLSWQPKR